MNEIDEKLPVRNVLISKVTGYQQLLGVAELGNKG
jgi:hypothetical protein